MTPLDSSNRTLVYDCEANGFLNEVTKMWCVVAQDYLTKELFLFHDFPEYDNFEGVDDQEKPFKIPARHGSLRDGVIFLHRAKGLICHNQIGYDQFLMNMFYPQFKIRYNYPEIRDTMLESQVQWFSRPAVKGYKGVHGLGPWGVRLGHPKQVVDDWTAMDAYKLQRCLVDVKINTEVAEHLDRERDQLYDNCNGITFDEALTTEHEYRYWSTIQELNGALVDVPHMKECVKELDILTEKLSKKIEPLLPPTVTGKGKKVAFPEICTLLGKPPIKKNRNNEQLERFNAKSFVNPTTTLYTCTKSKLYKVVNKDTEEEVTDYIFPKLREARDYSKTLEGKFIFPSKEVLTKAYNVHTINHFGESLNETKELVGAYTKIKTGPSRMSQHAQVKLYLVGIGWETDEWTFQKQDDQFVRADRSGTVLWPNKPINGYQLKTSYKAGERIPRTPKITKDSFISLPEGLGKDIKEYNTYSHRRKFIENPKKDDKGLLNNIRKDGRITCGLMTYGTAAGRATQNGWVNAPSNDALYGGQIRKIIVAPKGCKLVGIDMPSAHPRILADDLFTGNALFQASVDGLEEDPETGDYIGEDYHTVNSVLFGLNKPEDILYAKKTQLSEAIRFLSKGRKIGKGAGYTVIYGGSAKKLAFMLGKHESEGKAILDNFLEGLGLDKLIVEAEKVWKLQSHKRGSFINVLGGYPIFCNSKHKIINYKALGSEAVIQKKAVIWICRKIRELGLSVKLICNVHDELLFECPDKELEQFVPIASDMYSEAAKELGLTLNWKSHAKVGINYGGCH
jgi:hypothetical protein